MTDAIKLISFSGRSTIALLVFITLSLWIAAPSKAADLKACVFSLQPFGGTDSDGNLSGIIPEILSEIRKVSGLNFKINVVPYKRMFNDLAVGNCDFAIFFRTAKSEEIAIAKTKVYTLRNIVVGLTGLDLYQYEDLKGHTIALPRGTFYQEKFDNDPDLQKMLVPGFINAVKLLINKRTELIAGPEISIAHHLKQLDLTPDVLGKSLLLSHTSAWLQVSAKSKNLSSEDIQQLVNAIKKLHEDNIIEDIIQNFQHTAQPSETVSFGVIEMSPYTFTLGESTNRGILYETSGLILNTAGFTSQLHLLPIKRLLLSVTDGRIDCSLIAGTPKVKEIYKLVEPIGEQLVAGVIPKAGKSISNYSELAKLKIAVPQGVLFDPHFDNDTSLMKVTAKSYQHAIKLFLTGRVGAVAGSVTTYQFSAKILGFSPSEIFGQHLEFYKTDIWLGCGKDHPEGDKISRLQASVVELRENGAIRKIFDRFR